MDAQQDTINPSLIGLLPDVIKWPSSFPVTSLTLKPSSNVGNSFLQEQPSVEEEGEFSPSSLFDFDPDEELSPLAPHVQAGAAKSAGSQQNPAPKSVVPTQTAPSPSQDDGFDQMLANMILLKIKELAELKPERHSAQGKEKLKNAATGVFSAVVRVKSDLYDSKLTSTASTKPAMIFCRNRLPEVRLNKEKMTKMMTRLYFSMSVRAQQYRRR
jgi:hypothetical protein